jgi:DNA-binding NarL/FixJ family response regulator
MMRRYFVVLEMAMKQPVRVCIMHDHQLFSDVVTTLLQQEESIALVDAIPSLPCLDGRDLVEHTMPFDVALIDATMASMHAVHLVRQIKRLLPAVQVIVLGVEHLEEDILRFIEAGASGYILKNASYTELLHTINAVHHGQSHCSPRIAALVFARIAALARAQRQLQGLPAVGLTRREHEVLQLLARGCRNGEIAQQLGVALETVKRHVANMCKKFHVHGRRAVIQRAYAHGLLKGVGSAPWGGIAGPLAREPATSNGGYHNGRTSHTQHNQGHYCQN